MDDFFDAGQIRAASFVRHVEIHDTLGSTNDRAIELACETQIELPALVLARHQTAGRGRGANRWWSAEGALTFSLLLEPASCNITTRSWPQFSLATAVAVCDALAIELKSRPRRQPENRSSPLRLGIKWPNDVMLESKKVCGILIESPGGGMPAKERLIIGIGINVNNSCRAAPRAAGGDVIALSDFTKSNHDLRTVLKSVLQSIRTRINQLATNDARLPVAWHELSCLTGQSAVVHAEGASITGICVGIDAEAALLLENASGKHRIRSGSVRSA